MYNLYNFEAIFLIYLKKTQLPKKVQKIYLGFFRSFLNWLSLILDVNTTFEIPLAFLPFLENSSLEKYRKFLEYSKLNKHSVKIRLQVLQEFKSFLSENKTLNLNSNSNAQDLFCQALVEEFIFDLKEEGIKNLTLRNYKTDISQFLYFLTHFRQN